MNAPHALLDSRQLLSANRQEAVLAQGGPRDAAAVNFGTYRSLQSMFLINLDQFERKSFQSNKWKRLLKEEIRNQIKIKKNLWRSYTRNKDS